MGDIYFAKYPHFAIVGLEIMLHLCNVEIAPNMRAHSTV